MPLCNPRTEASAAAEGRSRYYLSFSLLFWAVAFFVFLSFILTRHSLIWMPDGWEQHYKALCYYATYLRKILYTLLRKHQLVIPNWEFALGEGGDILNMLHYYVIGDPIALLGVAVPLRWMHYFYSFSCVLRLYLAGLAFIALVLERRRPSPMALLAGALSYCFSMWSILCVARHPFFLNPLIWFPLLILGIEKLLQGKRPYCFLLAVVFSAVSNFYFFYMIAILGVLYAVVRLLLLRDLSAGKRFLLLLRMGFYAVEGACVAGILLLPLLFMFMADSRASVELPFRLFYPLSYYARLPAATLGPSSQNWYLGGLSVPVLLALFTLFLRKGQSSLLRVCSLICSIFLLFPIFARFFNGMSYAANRWSWAISLLGAYVLVDQWEGLFHLSGREFRRLLWVCIAWYSWMILSDKSRLLDTFAVVPLFFVALLLLQDRPAPSPSGRRPQRSLFILTVCNLLLLSGWFYTPGIQNYLQECMEDRTVYSRLVNSDATAVFRLSNGQVQRLSGRALQRNANLIAGISSTQSYWTNSNPWLNRYRTELEVNEIYFSMTECYGGRTVPLALAGVDYFVTPEYSSVPLPYGFEKLASRNLRSEELWVAIEQLRTELGTEDLQQAQISHLPGSLHADVTIYKNQYSLPLAYCYHSRLSRDQWEALDALQRQQLQLQAVCLEDPSGKAVQSELPELNGPFESYTLPTTVECLNEDVTQTEDGFLTTAKNAKVQIQFSGPAEAETYLHATGFSFQPTSTVALYSDDTSVDPLNLYQAVGWKLMSPAERITHRKNLIYRKDDYTLSLPVTTSSGVSVSLQEISADASFSAGRTDALLYLGYQKEPVTTVTISFPEIGRYHFQDLNVCAVPMKNYADQIAQLRQDAPAGLQFGVDEIRCSLQAEQPELLVVAEPYAKGWTATVDGEPTQVLLANGRYLGLELPAGRHDVRLHYTTPYLHAGAALSAFGLLLTALTVLLTERARRRKQKLCKRKT